MSLPIYCAGCHGCSEPCGRTVALRARCTSCWVMGDDVPAELDTRECGPLCGGCHGNHLRQVALMRRLMDSGFPVD